MELDGASYRRISDLLSIEERDDDDDDERDGLLELLDRLELPESSLSELDEDAELESELELPPLEDLTTPLAWAGCSDVTTRPIIAVTATTTVTARIARALVCIVHHSFAGYDWSPAPTGFIGEILF